MQCFLLMQGLSTVLGSKTELIEQNNSCFTYLCMCGCFCLYDFDGISVVMIQIEL